MSTDESNMKTNFRKTKYCIQLVVVAVSLATTVGASPLEISESGLGLRELTFILPQEVEFVAVEDGWKVVCEGQAGALPLGSPDLPAFSGIVVLQPGESLAVEAVTPVYEVVTQKVSVVAVPVRETVALDPGESVTRTVRRKDPEIYAQDAFWRNEFIRIDEAWQGRRKLARVELRPVQYNPATGTVRMYRSLKVVLRTVSSQDEEGPRGPIRPRPLSPSQGEGGVP